MLVLYCTNTPAQFRVDSVVFRLDSVKYECNSEGSPTHGSSYPHFRFVAKKITQLKDSVFCSGKGNLSNYRSDTNDATLALKFDSLNHTIVSCYYSDSYGYGFLAGDGSEEISSCHITLSATRRDES